MVINQEEWHMLLKIRENRSIGWNFPLSGGRQSSYLAVSWRENCILPLIPLVTHAFRLEAIGLLDDATRPGQRDGNVEREAADGRNWILGCQENCERRCFAPCRAGTAFYGIAEEETKACTRAIVKFHSPSDKRSVTARNCTAIKCSHLQPGKVETVQSNVKFKPRVAKDESGGFVELSVMEDLFLMLKRIDVHGNCYGTGIQ